MKDFFGCERTADRALVKYAQLCQNVSFYAYSTVQKRRRRQAKLKTKRRKRTEKRKRKRRKRKKRRTKKLKKNQKSALPPTPASQGRPRVKATEKNVLYASLRYRQTQRNVAA